MYFTRNVSRYSEPGMEFDESREIVSQLRDNLELVTRHCMMADISPGIFPATWNEDWNLEIYICFGFYICFLKG